MTDKTETLPEEQYVDVLELEVTEDATIRIQSDLFGAEFSTDRNPELRCGVTVTQDGSHIVIHAGTVNDSELPHFYTWSGLTPEQSRKLGDALHEAADNAEQSAGGERSKEDARTFLQRLMGVSG